MAFRSLQRPLTADQLRPLELGVTRLQFSQGLTDDEYRAVAALLDDRPDVTLRAYGGYGRTMPDLEWLRFKAWISDEITERWGAVYLWESAEAAEQELPSRARELIGRDPDIGETFDLEPSVEGRFEIWELSRLGLAFET